MVEKRISHCRISSYLYTLHLSDFFSYPSIGTSVLTAPPFTHITDVAAPNISRYTDSTASDKSIACVGAAPTFLFLRAAVKWDPPSSFAWNTEIKLPFLAHLDCAYRYWLVLEPFRFL